MYWFLSVGFLFSFLVSVCCLAFPPPCPTSMSALLVGNCATKCGSVFLLSCQLSCNTTGGIQRPFGLFTRMDSISSPQAVMRSSRCVPSGTFPRDCCVCVVMAAVTTCVCNALLCRSGTWPSLLVFERCSLKKVCMCVCE